jgi:hypothetical protein
MNKQSTIVAMTLLCCATVFLSNQAFGQALIVSEREKIVSYSDEELNPEKPRYEWEG